MSTRIYLDTCVWGRPFDKHDQERIQKESQALHKILSMCDGEKVEIVGSGVLLFEVSMIDHKEKRESVRRLIDISLTDFVELSIEVEDLGRRLMEKCGLGAMDAIHIAAAVENGVNIFLTTDDEIIRKRDCISEFGIMVKNPVEYIEETSR